MTQASLFSVMHEVLRSLRPIYVVVGRTMLYYYTILYFTMRHHVTSHHAVLIHTMPYHAIQNHTILYYAVLHCTKCGHSILLCCILLSYLIIEGGSGVSGYVAAASPLRKQKALSLKTL